MPRRCSVETIGATESSIKAITAAEGQLAAMAKVDALDVDQTLPPDEGQFRSREPVPLPSKPVLMRQFTPPPEGLRPPSPPPPEESGVLADAKKSSNSGAGQLVLPEEGSKQLPDQS